MYLVKGYTSAKNAYFGKFSSYKKALEFSESLRLERAIVLLSISLFDATLKRYRVIEYR